MIFSPFEIGFEKNFTYRVLTGWHGNLIFSCLLFDLFEKFCKHHEILIEICLVFKCHFGRFWTPLFINWLAQEHYQYYTFCQIWHNLITDLIYKNNLYLHWSILLHGKYFFDKQIRST